MDLVSSVAEVTKTSILHLVVGDQIPEAPANILVASAPKKYKSLKRKYLASKDYITQLKEDNIHEPNTRNIEKENQKFDK
uniref:Uncharacterized protein n=1 Tax=Oryza brachyantha TaxID=4533 RepID=J3N7D5_ORYBR